VTGVLFTGGLKLSLLLIFSGEAWPGSAWLGKARHGQVRHGLARHGTARQGFYYKGDNMKRPKQISVTMSDKLFDRLSKYKKNFSVSQICQEALNREIEKQELAEFVGIKRPRKVRRYIK